MSELRSLPRAPARPLSITASRPTGDAVIARAQLAAARDAERAGQLAQAADGYAASIAGAEIAGDAQVLSEALRRLAVVHQRRQQRDHARTLCDRSFLIAQHALDDVLAAEALNTLAAFAVEAGEYHSARVTFDRALQLGGQRSAALRGRIEQNLGVIANIQGDLHEALDHYQRSLDAFQTDGDERNGALARHNLGMVSADLGRWAAAESYLTQSLAYAASAGDVYLRGSCLLNLAEVLIARQRYEDARCNAEAALRIFDEVGILRSKSDAYKMLGIVYRDTGRAMLSEARFKSAIEIAIESGNALSEAESSRELARLYQQQGRNQDALKLFNAAHRLFKRLDARVDLIDVARKVQDFEGEYLAVVRDWGQSIESADSYTYGHCERVATYALAVAGRLGLDEDRLTTIRLGAYLHDLGKVRIPHEILNKPGRLTKEEFEVMQQHPVYGIEMLAAIEFPWDIKPIIRWHHEKADGTGYPDRLRGEEIPLEAQIVCIADIFDALTSSRSYRAAMPLEKAVAEMEACKHWWRAEVYEAFVSTLATVSS